MGTTALQVFPVGPRAYIDVEEHPSLLKSMASRLRSTINPHYSTVNTDTIPGGNSPRSVFDVDP